MIYIIDGYNVMHAREPDGIAREDLERKREAFIADVVNFAAVSGHKTIIVFDSKKLPEPEFRPVPNTNVTVAYASRSLSADIVIGQLVQKHLRDPGAAIRVVSGDWEVQKGAMQERAERIPPRNFLSGLNKYEKRLANSPEMDRMRFNLEDKVDVETLRKLEQMRRGED